MILIRECFIAKPGQAGKLAGLLKEAIATVPGKIRILTDLTGEFNRVVMETEVGSLGEFEARMKDYEANRELHERMKGYTDLYLTGGREILRVIE